MEEHKLEHAWHLHKHGRHEMAIEKLRDILSEDPEHAVAHGVLADCLLAQTRIHAAEYEIQIALQLDPNTPYFLLVKAHIAVFKQKFNDALAYCDEALMAIPDYAPALLLKSEVYMLIDKRDEAYQCIKEASEAAPDDKDVFVAFGEYYFATGDYNQAQIYARDALAIDAQDEGANILIGKTYLAQGDIEQAQYHAKFVILNNPESEAALQLFSHIKMRTSLLLGTWWRFNSWVAALGNTTGVVVLISAFLVFNLLAQLLTDIGYAALGKGVSYTWLILVIYSWVGLPMYYRALKKELEAFRFNPDF